MGENNQIQYVGTRRDVLRTGTPRKDWPEEVRVRCHSGAEENKAVVWDFEGQEGNSPGDEQQMFGK